MSIELIDLILFGIDRIKKYYCICQQNVITVFFNVMDSYINCISIVLNIYY